MGKHLLAVKHNIEVAHRLSLLPGKCENIHGHSMWVTIWIEGELDHNGILEGVSFTDLKKVFRHHLDTQYDHHLLLNIEDPWAQGLIKLGQTEPAMHGVSAFRKDAQKLPGLQTTPGDPTTENIALWIANWAKDEDIPVHAVDVWETSVNMSRYKET